MGGYITAIRHRPHGEHGNVLFLILIGVALFAALSYAVTQSSRSSSDGGLSKDKAKLAASEIVQYATSIEQAITRLRLVNRCTDAQISFQNLADLNYTNAAAPSDSRCHIFNPAGGQLSYFKPNAEWLDPANQSVMFYGSYLFTGMPYVMGVPDGANTADLIFILPYISRDLCVAINTLLKYNAPTFAPPVIPGHGWTNASTVYFTGTYGALVRVMGTSNPVERSGCVEGQSGRVPDVGTYHFFATLIAR